MNQEQISFLNTLPLSPHQRAFVDACWNARPEANKKMPRWEMADKIIEYIFPPLLCVGVLLFRQPLILIPLLVWVWLVAVVSGFFMVVIASATAQSYPDRTRRWRGQKDNADDIFTCRSFIGALKPRSLFRTLWQPLIGILGVAGLMATRHWITAVIYGAYVVMWVVFREIMPMMTKKYITTRAQSYAAFHNLEPEVTPADMNPDHPRPILSA